MKDQTECLPLIIIAGNAYAMGASRDGSAKASRLLRGKAILTQSFEPR